MDLGGRTIVLATTSERRIGLLESLGLGFEVVDPSVDEASLSGPTPEATARVRARAKAQAVAALRPDALVLAADTVVAVGEELLPKARDTGEVRSMLRRLSGREHAVITAVALLDSGTGDIVEEADIARVLFRELTDAEVEWYASTGEGVGKAGGYAVQGLGGTLVSRLDGDREMVVGLPTALVGNMLDDRTR